MSSKIAPKICGASRAPRRSFFSGRFVEISPLKATHAPILFEAVGGADQARLWEFMSDGPFLTEPEFCAALADKEVSQDPLFFALIPQDAKKIMGYAALMRFDGANGVVEIGHIMLAPKLQRTPAASEAMFLIAHYVFETLNCRRFEWKCNDANAPSKRAALRFGFVYEGCFRQHMIVKGRNRDTAWFSMLDSEWPQRKAEFLAWLAPDNFDADGRQRRSLEQIRSHLTLI